MHPQINPSLYTAAPTGPQVYIPNSYFQPGRPPLTCMPVIQPGLVQPSQTMVR
jgi:hypothetical protein